MTVQDGSASNEYVITADKQVVKGSVESLQKTEEGAEAVSEPAVKEDRVKESGNTEKSETVESEEKEEPATSISSDNGSGGNGSTGFADYLVLGMKHIWGGIDHLLFIVGLLLMRASVKDYVKILTAFTLGHSLTLGLAAMKILIIPPSIIEPLIALSIVYVAVENIWARKRGEEGLKWRWLVVLLFGFIHGFGFADFLAGKLEGSFAMPLFSFNLGVEIGQIAVLSVLFPVICYMRKLRYQTQIMYSASALVSLCGLYWLIERIL
ncbi:HupE/UreJ family protein [Bacillus salacetis]|nr:HupE/UreJ family protein [Bacillus salacetis]